MSSAFMTVDVVVRADADAPVLPLTPLSRQLLGLLAAAVGPDETFHVSGGSILGDPEEKALIAVIAHASDLAHFGIADGAAGHGRRNPGQ
jgi:hypothetical protein